MVALSSRSLGRRLYVGSRMRGMHPHLAKSRAGRVEAYPEIDLADPRAVHDIAAGCVMTLPPEFNAVKNPVPGPSAIPQNTGGPRWEVLWRSTPMWRFNSHDPETEMRRLADIAKMPVRNLRLRQVRDETETRVAVRPGRDADAVTQLTARVRSLLLRKS